MMGMIHISSISLSISCLILDVFLPRMYISRMCLYTQELRVIQALMCLSVRSNYYSIGASLIYCYVWSLHIMSGVFFIF